MVDVARIEILQDEIGWVLRVSNPGLRTQEYRCSSRQQAQALGEVLTGTKTQPKPPKAGEPAGRASASLPKKR